MEYRKRLSIAGMSFEISTDHRLISRFVDSYFAAFLCEDYPEYSITIESEVPIPVSGVKRRAAPEIEKEQEGGYRIVNNGSDRIVVGHIDNEKRVCRLNGRSCVDTYLLSSVIRICAQFWLEHNGGFFLKAACASVAGRGVLFTGKSNAGKAAFLRNLRPDTIIAEDEVALRVTESQTRVYAIPFRGERPSDIALDAVCFPYRCTGSSQLMRENGAKVAEAIKENALFCAPSSEEIMACTLDAITLCSMSVPAYGCFFDTPTDLHAVFAANGVFD